MEWSGTSLYQGVGVGIYCIEQMCLCVSEMGGYGSSFHNSIPAQYPSLLGSQNVQREKWSTVIKLYSELHIKIIYYLLFSSQYFEIQGYFTLLSIFMKILLNFQEKCFFMSVVPDH